MRKNITALYRTMVLFAYRVVDYMVRRPRATWVESYTLAQMDLLEATKALGCVNDRRFRGYRPGEVRIDSVSGQRTDSTCWIVDIQYSARPYVTHLIGWHLVRATGYDYILVSRVGKPVVIALSAPYDFATLLLDSAPTPQSS